MNDVYRMVKQFKRKYPFTIAWRLKKNSMIVQKHLNPGEKIKYAFAAQKNNGVFSLFSTCVVVLTNQRLLVGYKRVIFGYYFSSITPDMYNDLQVYHGLLWGRIAIDTIDEEVYLSNIAPSALVEIETNVTRFMIREKKKFLARGKKESCDKTKADL